MPRVDRHYHQAAIAYLIYGLLYLGGAVYLTAIGESARGMAGGGIWWFLFGALMVVVLPVLIWKGFEWVIRILAVLVFIRIAGLVHLMATEALEIVPLPGGIMLPRIYGAAAFASVAAIVFAFLVRAGWPDRFVRARSETEGA